MKEFISKIGLNECMMQDRLYILYKDESGNLKLHGKSFNLYIYNNGNVICPLLYLVSENNTYILNLAYFNSHLYNDDLSEEDYRVIYNYIKDKWCDMMNTYNSYFKTGKYFTAADMPPFENYNDYSTTPERLSEYTFNISEENILCHEELNFGDRLGICDLVILNDFMYQPILHIRTTNFDCMIDMIYTRYFNNQKLTDNECEILDNFMHQFQDNEIKRYEWGHFIGQWIWEYNPDICDDISIEEYNSNIPNFKNLNKGGN